MSIIQNATPRVHEQLRLVKVFTLAQLISLFCCSRRTAQRSLSAWRCHTSYNANASYYALPEVVRFDSRGIWRCGSVAFSCHGNLTDTLQALVNTSPEGMTARELRAVVKVDVHSLLPPVVRAGKLTRAKSHGAFVHFASNPAVRRRQEEARHGRGLPGETLSDADAVTVLVAFIQEPILASAELADRVRTRAPTATPAAIDRFFQAHGLDPAKKGALHSRPSSCSDSTNND